MTTTVNAQTWDKTFPKSDKVTTEKVSFKNRYNIDVVADIYMPEDLDKSKKHPAIVIGHPFGGVKTDLIPFDKLTSFFTENMN